ncbi:MAG: GntR family transcriptional regulator [Victivallaceae bacterium]|jgi:GntR family transcriptional regulator of arabinose operon
MLKKIDGSVPMPKYYQISESLKAQIVNGKLRPGDKIPSSRELSGYFNTTQVTVLNALRYLETAGYIYKTQGKGVFVCEQKTAATSASKQGYRQAGLIMASKDDMYQNLADTLIAELQQKNYYAIPLGNYLTSDAFSCEDKELRIQKYVEDNFDSLIIEGTRHVPYRNLHRNKEQFRQLNYVIFYETKLEFPDANKIICDFYKAGYLGGQHLLNSGKKRLAMLTFEPYSPALAIRHGCVRETFDFAIAAGLKQSMEEAGIDSKSHLSVIHDIVPAHDSTTENNIADFIRGGGCGIFAVADFRALKVYHAAKKQGLKIGSDVSVVGLFNTSWAEVISPALTSICVNEEQIGKITAQCITEQLKGETIIVSPELIIRES